MLNIELYSYRRGARKGGSLCAKDRDAALVEAAGVLLGSDFKVYSEDEVCAGEVQVHG